MTGEIFDEIQLDGIYVAGMVCLIASHGPHPVAWQWAESERVVAWKALLAQLPPPIAVTTDGGSGLNSALKACWSESKHQRCLVHVQRNIRRASTRTPRTNAGRDLRKLSLALTKITTSEQADHWLQALHDYGTRHKDFLEEKTYRGKGPAPAGISPLAPWWFTHDKVRTAYRTLSRLASSNVLFTYLDPELAGLSISSTTNMIEGGINTVIRDVLRRHRGMPSEHQQRAVEWVLYSKSAYPQPPHTFITAQAHNPPKRPAVTPEKDPGPAKLDPHFSWEDGNGIRHGRGGRSH